MPRKYVTDTAELAFQPLINLKESPFANLSSQAPLHWINLKRDCAQWGAFMHFFGPTRKLLKVGGLEIEDKNPFNIKTDHPEWNSLLKSLHSKSLDVKKQLFVARLFFYLGFYEDGLKLCDEVSRNVTENEEYGWALYLKDLGQNLNSPLSWNPNSSETLYKTKGLFLSPLLRLHISLMMLKYHTRNTSDLYLANKWNQVSLEIIKNHEFPNSADQCLAEIRLAKYEADMLFKLKQDDRATAKLKDSIERTKDKASNLNNSPSYVYLFKETARRTLDRLVLFNLNAGHLPQANNYANQAIELDPFCSYANLLAALTETHQDTKKAKTFLLKSAEYGIIERPYSKWALAHNFPQVTDPEKNLHIIDSNKGSCFLFPKNNLTDEKTTYTPPHKYSIARKGFSRKQYKESMVSN